MSETINPASSPRGAAQQIVLELIKAGKLGGGNEGAFVIATYEKLVEEYERINSTR
ncbi:hypothetical protein V2154_16755 [Ewingella sp. CoE-038-23]|uniref:hypothetical protein n=1 Tax=Ewingella docleensis TaxID=3118588 RepID=UPI0033657A10